MIDISLVIPTHKRARSLEQSFGRFRALNESGMKFPPTYISGTSLLNNIESEATNEAT